MNFSREPSDYHYNKRSFYGPLQTDDDPLLPGRLEALKHPDDEHRVVRTFVKVGSFDSYDVLNETLDATRDLLANLEKHGISHVRPEYINNQYEINHDSDTPLFAIVMDKIPNSFELQSIIDSGDMTDDQVREVDRVLMSLADYIVDVINDGGPMSEEIVNLGQFVYAPDRESGRRVVLVDVEPIGCSYMAPHQYDDKTTMVLEMLLDDTAKVRMNRPDMKLSSLPALMRAIDYVSTGSQDAYHDANRIRRKLYGKIDPDLQAARNED